jgi:hypothetical protein
MYQRYSEEVKLTFEEEKAKFSENLKLMLNKLQLEITHSFEMFSAIGGHWVNIAFADLQSADRFLKVFTVTERPKVMVLHDGSCFCNINKTTFDKVFDDLINNRHSEIESKVVRPYNDYLLDTKGPGHVGIMIF